MNVRKVFKEKIESVRTESVIYKTSSTPSLLKKPNDDVCKMIISPQPQMRTDNFSPESSDFYQTLQNKLNSARQSLLNNINQVLESDNNKEHLKNFHKNSNFIDRKQKIKENVKNHKFQSSCKLLKVKSIVGKIDKCMEKEFITQDDVLNGEAMQFLQLNKRKFGKGKIEDAVLWQKKKSNDSKGINFKMNGRNSSMPEFNSSGNQRTAKDRDYLINNKKKLVSDISDPVKKYILDEMKKLWPPDTQRMNEKKRKILRVKIGKLQSILEEVTKEQNEDGNLRTLNSIRQTIKMDKMVNQHFRSLRKKLL